MVREQWIQILTVWVKLFSPSVTRLTHLSSGDYGPHVIGWLGLNEKIL